MDKIQQKIYENARGHLDYIGGLVARIFDVRPIDVTVDDDLGIEEKNDGIFFTVYIKPALKYRGDRNGAFEVDEVEEEVEYLHKHWGLMVCVENPDVDGIDGGMSLCHINCHPATACVTFVKSYTVVVEIAPGMDDRDIEDIAYDDMCHSFWNKDADEPSWECSEIDKE